jgi:probable HAF family extracellular repeat protein
MMALITTRSAIGLATLTFTLILALAMGKHAPRAAAPPGPYVLTDLGTLGGASAQATDVNRSGQAVGYSTNASSQGRAFLWQNGSMIDLGTLGGPAVANGINEFGQVAGTSTLGVGSWNRAVLWDGTAKINLTPNLGASDSSAAYAVNDARHVAGALTTFNVSKAFVWRDGVLTVLADSAGLGAYAFDINNSDQVAGSTYSPILTPLGRMLHATLWEDGTATDLGLLPGDEDSSAVAINSFGQIAGSSGRTDPETYESFYRPFLYSGGMMTAIQVPSGEAYASDINDSGVVVGTMRAGGGLSNFHAWIYADGIATNLNTVIPAAGLHLVNAQAISNDGRIAGTAIDAQGHYHAFLLTPGVEENPTIYANIGDVELVEGNSGARAAAFAVTLSPAPKGPVSLTYATGVTGGSATPKTDYQAASGTLTMAAGQTRATISVMVNGDRKRESDESFFVTLTGAQGAVLVDNRGVGIIRDDDR